MIRFNLCESWSEAAVAVNGSVSLLVGELGGERQSYSRIQEG